jgi:hypothetical protein
MFQKFLDNAKNFSKGMISKLSIGLKTVRTMFKKLDTSYPNVSRVLDTLVSSSETASGVKKAFNLFSGAIDTLNANYKTDAKPAGMSLADMRKPKQE